MRRIISIGQTVTESRFFVMPYDTNPIGRLHGGRLMEWMISSAALCSVKFSRGDVVLAALDDLFFLSPVSLGDMVVIKAWVEYTGRSSMEIGISAYTYPHMVGEPVLTTTSHMVFVAVDSTGKPRPLPHTIEPKPGEENVYKLAEARALRRKTLLGTREQASLDVDEYGPDARFRMKSSHLVTLEEARIGGIMSGGHLLHILDELTGALAASYAKNIVVTASVDSTVFVYPIREGNIIDIEAVLTGAGRTSIEVAAKVVTENPSSGVRRHAVTTYLTMVSVDSTGKPVPVPPYTPQNETERKMYEMFLKRRADRMKKVEDVKALEKLHHDLVFQV
ncbi:MAG: acyl-CoA thioesterase [Candidatus Caldarchaeum sp.]|nr:acyl-CoA thioesterase [Candidatus Caldarchaeum sp.]MCX8201708.1 acyl-CoA thioesterase [Candidatus Caldarchaeum sp.]